MGFERSDYLKRQFDQLGRALGKLLADLLGIKQQGQPGEVLALLDQRLQELLTLSVKQLAAIAPRELVPTLQQEYKLEPHHLEPMADVLCEAAEGFLLQHDAQTARALWERALVLYTHLEADESLFSFERHFKIKRLQELLQA
ncbi:hypothetical protein [Cesiribacter andamanensis]|uniref:Uncharacterized protein n=1 Tax=Cesiribacter andamanensis AMV16 TaxID=1279009 RepID=M7N1J4_9BACT|nr:hypothetical protein [Cesiribacter andamanensis]EMR01162.1 hypothetical protein ADICEAN_03709 [Cesiribacter andamanensis AMV16]